MTSADRGQDQIPTKGRGDRDTGRLFEFGIDKEGGLTSYVNGPISENNTTYLTTSSLPPTHPLKSIRKSYDYEV